MKYDDCFFHLKQQHKLEKEKNMPKIPNNYILIIFHKQKVYQRRKTLAAQSVAEKSCIRESKNLSKDADSTTNPFLIRPQEVSK